VKRSGPLARSASLTADPQRTRAWQQRSQRAALTRAQQRATTPAPKSRKAPRRNDSGWRAECLEARGDQCRVPDCPHPRPVQMDHLIARAQGGPSVVANGTPLCRVHHEMKTDHLLLVDPAWLDPDQVQWLADEGHAVWRPEDGVVTGRHCRIFADRSM
jgi:hypothetical protein